MMESREQRIMTLATTLKSSGIAKTDSQAKMMAEEMIGVEEHVQKSYDVEHDKAHEYLSTQKNLRTPMSRPAPEPKVEQPVVSQSNSSRYSSSSNSSNSSSNQSESRKIEPLNFSASQNSKTDNSHNTGNSVLEAIKAQVSQQRIIPLEDQDSTVDVSKSVDSVSEEKSSIGVASVESTEQKIVSEPVVEKVVEISTASEDSNLKQVESETTSAKLDSEKLIELMEEDGNKMEEHTREIKTKPENIKPKEEYAENNIDLASVFSFNKK